MWDKTKPIPIEPTEEDIKWYCVAHWLDTLYEDYLTKRVAGEKAHPCENCIMIAHCKEKDLLAPPYNFDILSEKTDEYVNANMAKILSCQ